MHVIDKFDTRLTWGNLLWCVEREDDKQEDDLFDGILSSHNFPDSENANRLSSIRNIRVLCKDLYSLQYCQTGSCFKIK